MMIDKRATEKVPALLSAVSVEDIEGCPYRLDSDSQSLGVYANCANRITSRKSME